MKKFAILAAVFMLSGCAWMNPFNWWGGDKPAAETEVGFKPNPFLWQAALDKLAFMQDIEENRKDGTITTGWTVVDGASYRVEVRVLSDKLRSDCLKVRVEKRLRSGQGWQPETASAFLQRQTEDAIFDRARILYRDSLNLQ